MKNLLYTLLVVLTIAACNQEEIKPGKKASDCLECYERYIEVQFYDTLVDSTRSLGKFCTEAERVDYDSTHTFAYDDKAWTIDKFWYRTCPKKDKK